MLTPYYYINDFQVSIGYERSIHTDRVAFHTLFNYRRPNQPYVSDHNENKIKETKGSAPYRRKRRKQEVKRNHFGVSFPGRNTNQHKFFSFFFFFFFFLRALFPETPSASHVLTAAEAAGPSGIPSSAGGTAMRAFGTF